MDSSEIVSPQSISFQSLTYGALKIDEVIFYIKAFLEEVPDATYSLIIGTDSHEKNGNQGNKGKDINLVTAILIHRKGFGGRYFWRRKGQSNIHSLREKIYAETMMSLNFASTFVPLFKKSLNGKAPNYDLEIHIDVGEHGDTRDMIKEV
ncbi:MAG: ribonuclease H-like YkuK family protein, partial [Candidatus Levyibacteriota bacterium]